jgi:endonuclease/exonuclease/phosphatase family metal-dependent hydrolase
MNDGKGPDIIAICEVESVRAADLLRATLNKKLDDAKADKKLQYKDVVMRNLDAGRHIAPAIITRMNVAPALTKMHGNKLRILESHLSVNGHDLCIMASHWTSQLKQRDGSDGDAGRDKYAIAIYEAFRAAAKKDVNTDFLVCGDFNDTPDANPVVKALGAIGDKNKVKPTDNEPYLLDLMAGKDAAKFGTIFYNGKPLIYDQICVSPGLLDDKGWSVDPDSIHTETAGLIRKGATRREPWRFGSPGHEMKDDDRGFSDHFPVTVRLKVAPAKGKE